MPLYKTKPSPGFASTTDRVLFGKDRTANKPSLYTNTADNANFAIGVETPQNAISNNLVKEDNINEVPALFYLSQKSVIGYCTRTWLLS